MEKNRISTLSPLVIISPSLGKAHPGAIRLSFSYLPNSVTFAPSSSFSVTILLLFPSLASALDVLHHLLTLLVPPLLLLINPESNPALLLKLVIEVILGLLWGTWSRLLSAWNLNKRVTYQYSRQLTERLTTCHLVSPVGVCSCICRWGWRIHIVLFFALQLLIVVKVVVLVRPVVPIVEVVHAL